jgi:UDP-N-acetylmuramate dehydrogenase
MLTIQSNVSLLPYTTFRIPVQAKYFVEITSEDDLLDLFASPLFQQERKQILGGGAKTFFTKDFDGLVIKVSIKGISRLRGDTTANNAQCRDTPLVRPIATRPSADNQQPIIVRV